MRKTLREREQAGGWVLLEAIVSLAILGLLIAGMTGAQRATGRLNECCLLKQRCLAAAQAQLDSIAATGGRLDEKDRQRLWPGVKLEVRTKPGKGDWAGLTLVEVKASAEARKHGPMQVSVVLCRYLPGQRRP